MEWRASVVHQSSLGRPYTRSLPDDASNADVDSHCKDSMDSEPYLYKMEGVHELGPKRRRIGHLWGLCRGPIHPSPLASSFMKGIANESAAMKAPLFDAVRPIISIYIQSFTHI